MLPDIDGFEVCRRIRASGSKMGIIMLTAKNQEIDKVTGLMTGADITRIYSALDDRYNIAAYQEAYVQYADDLFDVAIDAWHALTA